MMEELTPRGREVLDILIFVRELSLRGRFKQSDLDKRLAVIHVDNAVELMLKDYLEYVKREFFERISFPELLKRCLNLKIINSYYDEIKALHEARNKLYHGHEYRWSPRDEWLEKCITIAEELFKEIYGETIKEFSKREYRVTLALYRDYLKVLEARFREKGTAPGAPWTTVILGSDALKIYGKEVHFYAHWMPTRPKFLGGLRTEVLLKCNLRFYPMPLEDIKDLVELCEFIRRERGRGVLLGKPIHRFWLGFASFNEFEEKAVRYVKGLDVEGLGVALVNIIKEPYIVARTPNEDGKNAAYWFRV